MIICSLGISGSGKTVFLSSLMDNLFSSANSTGGYYLSDINNSDYKSIFEDVLDRNPISLNVNISLTEDDDSFSGYPTGTRATVAREFAFRTSAEELLNITWVDYKGGLVSEGAGSTEEMQDLYSYLDASSALVVFIDGYRLAAADNIKQARLHTDAIKISQVVSHLINKLNKKSYKLLFVLTQTDAIENMNLLGVENNWSPLVEKAKEVYSGVIEDIKASSNWTVGMVPVSAVGMGNNVRTKIVANSENSFLPDQTQDKIIAYPEPINVVESFFWLAAQEMLKSNLSEKQIDEVIRKVHVQESVKRKKSGLMRFFPKGADSDETSIQDLIKYELEKLEGNVRQKKLASAKKVLDLSSSAVVEL